ncbi:hypothetical protein BKP37_08810 [Anaerobacillus alkalilacustris]|uniref:Fido domain-containing protein n=1 Tax=Anaerobacillus alkalilacustris TaxID=393763 RepID=A0A1S2LRH3_9BACI|nr:Fic family protein [Anaerobacillus alkalilacustris]OIJ14267.1 hypothetical protein BKP37_08810 [Anaerobacillus alkalilacustris]
MDDFHIKYDSNLLQELYEKFTIERYLNKPEIMYRLDSNLLQIRANLWGDILEKRKMNGRLVALKDQDGNKFWYSMTQGLEKLIHDIDVRAKERLDELVVSEIQQRLLIESLIDEAFFSSVIEGAFSTKKRTRELVKSKDPKNKSEKMILNNYHALEFILENLHSELNEEIFLSLHKIITENTLEEDEITEKYRDGPVYVMSENQTKTEPIYVAPPLEDVQPMMDELFSFINNEKQFINPIIKAFIIHFYIVYVHPFYDGNGRVARAFSYMYLLKKGYNFFRFFSISTVVNQKKGKYYKAIKDTEDYGSDLTYFIKAYSEMTLESIEDMITKLNKELEHDLLSLELEKDDIILSKRQKKFLTFIKGKESNITTIQEYLKKMKVSYETARTDLSELTELGIFKRDKKGKKYIYKYLGLKGYKEY